MLQSQSSVVLTQKGNHDANRVSEYHPERADRSYAVDDGDSVRRLARAEDFLSVRDDRKAEEPAVRCHCEKESRLFRSLTAGEINVYKQMPSAVAECRVIRVLNFVTCFRKTVLLQGL